MTKIEELLKQLGASSELTKQILEALEAYKNDVKKKLEEEFKTRAEKAKQLCSEELEKEKAEIARKMEVFLETHTNQVVKEAQRQAAVGESAATKTLRGVKSLVEGVEIGSKEDSQASEELKALRVQNRQLSEQVEKMSLKANRATAIAMGAIKRNRILESKIPAPISTPQTVIEDKKASPVQPTTLGSLKKVAHQPATTRPALTESVAKPAAPVAKGESVDPDVAAIADKLDGSPAFITG